MADTPEGKVKKKVKGILQKYGFKGYWPVPGGLGEAGVHDCIVCAKGFYFTIECKAGKNKMTALQKTFAADVQAAGGVSFEINETNLGDLDRFCLRIHQSEVKAPWHHITQSN